MVLTPQLLQAIKLLQMPNVELSAFIETELSSNPLPVSYTHLTLPTIYSV